MRFQQIILCVCVALLPFFASCASSGGGNVGTGIVTVKGSVRNDSAQPLAGVEVTVINTGDTTLSDSLGYFSLVTETDEENLSVSITSGDVAHVAEIAITDPGNTTVLSMEIIINEDSGSVELRNVEMMSKIVGKCDYYFENHRDVVMQANKTPASVDCLAKTWLSSEGAPLSGLNVMIQYRACAEGSPWKDLSWGKTNGPPHSGIAQIPFTFIDSEERCVYRVVAPYLELGYQEAEQLIYTMTKRAHG